MLEFSPEGIDRYLSAHTSSEPEVFQALARETREATDKPEMQVGLVEGMLLKILARSTGARRILEIGTFTGYSTLMLAEGTAEDAEIMTCDIDRKNTEIARKYWAQSPHGAKIALEIGPALKTLETIEGPIDIVFIDADKQNYIQYWESCLPKVRPGGLIIADNVLWSARVLHPQEPDDHALAAFNDHVINDERVDTVMLSVRDGITLACKR